MPTVRIGDGGVPGGEPVVSGAPLPAGATGDVARITTNQTLADHIGKFVAGEVLSKYKDENLVDVMKGKAAIMISISWG
jgi:hypothetical protein